MINSNETRKNSFTRKNTVYDYQHGRVYCKFSDDISFPNSQVKYCIHSLKKFNKITLFVDDVNKIRRDDKNIRRDDRKTGFGSYAMDIPIEEPRVLF